MCICTLTWDNHTSVADNKCINVLSEQDIVISVTVKI